MLERSGFTAGCSVLAVTVSADSRALLDRVGQVFRSWQARLAELFRSAGLRHVLCTDIDRDGALSGPNLALYREAAARYPDLHWQASGGVSSIADLHALAAAGATAAVSGTALLEERLSPEGLQPFLRVA